MGHMENIRKNTTMIVTFAAVLSLSIGFLPQVMAGTGSSSLALTLEADCGFGVSDVTVAVTADPGLVTTATFTVNFANTGSASLPVGASLGDAVEPIVGTVGGFAASPRAVLGDVAVLPNDVTMNADLGGPGGTTTIGTVGTQNMNNDGTDQNIAALGPTGAAGEIDVEGNDVLVLSKSPPLALSDKVKTPITGDGAVVSTIVI